MSRNSRRPSYDRHSDPVGSNVIVDMKIACIVTICAILWSTILIGETAHSKRSRDRRHDSGSKNATLEFRTVSVHSQGSSIVRHHPPVRSTQTQQRIAKSITPSNDPISMNNRHLNQAGGKINPKSQAASIHLELLPSIAHQQNQPPPRHGSKSTRSVPGQSRDISFELTRGSSPTRARFPPPAEPNGGSSMKRRAYTTSIAKRLHEERALPTRTSHRRLNTRSLRTERSYEPNVNQVEEMIAAKLAKIPEGYEKGAIRIEPVFQVVKKKGMMDSVLELLRKMMDPSKAQPGPLIGPMHFPGVGDKVYVRLLEPTDADHVVIRLVTQLPLQEIEASFKQELLSSVGSIEIPEVAFSVNQQVAFPHSVDSASSPSLRHWIQSMSPPATTFHPPVFIHEQIPQFPQGIANHTGLEYGQFPDMIHGEASKKIEVQAKQDRSAPQEYRYFKDVKYDKFGKPLSDDQRGGFFAKENGSVISKRFTEKKGNSEEHEEQLHSSNMYRDRSFHPYYMHLGRTKPQYSDKEKPDPGKEVEKKEDRSSAYSSNSDSSSLKSVRSNRMASSNSQNLKSYPEEDGALRVITPPRIAPISSGKYSKETSDWFESQRTNYNVTKRSFEVPKSVDFLPKAVDRNVSASVERTTIKNGVAFTTESWRPMESNLTATVFDQSQRRNGEAQDKAREKANRKAISTSTVKPILSSSTTKSPVNRNAPESMRNVSTISKQNSTNILLQRVNCSRTNGTSSYEEDEREYVDDEYYEDYYEDVPTTSNSTIPLLTTTTLKPTLRNLTAARVIKSKIVMRPKLRPVKVNSTTARAPLKRGT